MTKNPLPRILVVDDEEAILETMTFTFEEEYEVLTSSDARRALDLLDEHQPVAVVLTDQRMPQMSGVEFLTEVCQRHPTTVRIILTGFTDMDAIIPAINDGHVYAYITKPWEPSQLKQVMKRAVEHYELTVENERLLRDLKHANLYLESVMDQLDTGALAVDADGIIQAASRPVRDYLALPRVIRGRPLSEVLAAHGLDAVAAAALNISSDADGDLLYDEVETRNGDQVYRLRVTTRGLVAESGETIGRMLQLREISHEPMRRSFDEIVWGIVETDGDLRESLEAALEQLRGLGEQMATSPVDSPGMSELADRLSRTLTATQNWLDVDDAMAGEDFPDAQLLRDRMRVALARWPLGNEVPGRVRELLKRVEHYYESGENLKQRVL
jgi:FixJ family two-component response regulator